MKRKLFLIALILTSFFSRPTAVVAQNVPFSSGIIPMCDTSYFTANVSGIGTLYPYGSGSWWNFSLTDLLINVTSNHPQTLSITLTSPQGTSLLLSQFNGAGGSNYTNTNFSIFAFTNINTGAAPFTGNWVPEGGTFSVFDWENGDGIWTITIIDTACSGGGGGGGGGGPAWTDGFFNGGGGGIGGFTFNPSSPPPPPCPGWVTSGAATICQGESFDLMTFYTSLDPTMTYSFSLNWVPVPNPNAVSIGGNYSVEAIDWMGCVYFNSFILTVDPGPSLGPDLTQNLVCNVTGANLAALFNLTSLTSSWTLNGAPIPNTTAMAAFSSGVYQLIAQTSTGCNDTALVTLNTSPGFNLGANQSTSICDGSTLDLTTLFSTVGLTSTWYYGGLPVANPSTVSNSGVYTLIAIDAGSCTDTLDVTLTVNAGPALGNDLIIDTCITGNFDLTGLFNTSGFTSSWTYGGAPVLSPTSVSSNGAYLLVASTSGICLDSALVNLNISPIPSLGGDIATSICDNEPINLTNLLFAGPNSSSWYLSGNPISAPTSTSIAGTYTHIVTSVAGCSDTADIVLSVNPAPTLGTDQTINSCTNSGIDLTSFFNTIGSTSAWTSNGSAVPNPSLVTNSGTYQLIATNGLSCSDTALVVLNLSSQPALGPDQSITICSGSNVDLTLAFNPNGNSTAWFLGGTPISPPSSANTSGVYSLIVTSSAGCTDTADVVLTVNASPTLGIDQTHSICSNIAFDLTSLYTTIGSTSVWMNGTTVVSNPSQIFNSGNYLLIATNANGCIDSATVQVNHMNAPLMGVDQNISLCTGNSLDLTAVYNTNGLSSSWTNSGSPVLNPNSVILNGNYMLIVTDLNGCKDTANVQLTLLPSPNLGGDQIMDICDGNEIDLNSLFNTTGLTVNWTLNSAPVSNPSSITIAGLYQLLATNNVGCSDSAFVEITILPKPNLGADQFTSSCDGISINLSNLFSLNGLTPAWTLSGNPINNASAILTAGTYELIVSNASGCLDTSLVTVTINSLPILGPDANYALCPWQTLDLSQVYNISNYTALYTYQGNPVVNYTSVHDSGYYSVLVTDSNGCTNQATVEVINVFCRCDADFEFTARCIQDPLSFKLLADSLVVDAHWNFSTANTPDVTEENPTIHFKSVGKHLVTLQATLSCGVVEVTKWVEVKDCADSCQIWIPNSFSPNDDGKNEQFGFYSECQPEQFKANIYDRFGKLIYQSTNIVDHWDGKIDGEYMTSGIFVYRVTCKMPYKDEEILTGKITIIR
ncbi:MAG: gliding motility-associated C-terminal domain-containing protein [Bacteroidetes bacterium]|nr:gliding motility-associated C-terminal domain-containing protein [Bacteroidota bacterium]